MIETEIKLPWSGSIAEARAHLKRLSYTVSKERALERNQLFDRPSGELRRAGEVLRLRRVENGDHTQAMVTFKGPAAASVHKSREEIEFTVSDPESALLVLERLGYHPGFVYEKYRTEFRAPGEPGVIALDETPIGIFLELEGPANWIDSTAAGLGFSSGRYITESYARLYHRYQDQHPSALRNMTFISRKNTKPEIKDS